MTAVALDWVTLSTPEFVAWTRLVDVRLPFPLSSGALSYIAAPSGEELEQALAARKLVDSSVLAATRSAFAEPRLSVYAVRATPDAAETRFLAIADRTGQAVLAVVDAEQAAVRSVAETELAAGVVGALAPLRPLRFADCEVTPAGMREADALVEAGVSARTFHARMAHLGFAEELIALRQRVGNAAAPSGALAAMWFPDGGEPRHATRSATWREYDEGAALQVERRSREGAPAVLLTPATPEALFRAAVDAVASCYEPAA